jgi:hypothetical protein
VARAGKRQVPVVRPGKPSGQPATAAAGLHHHVRLRLDVPEKPTTQLSWEAAPGKTTNYLPEFHDAPLAQRKEFQEAIAKVIEGKGGEDLIADRIGLKSSSTFVPWAYCAGNTSCHRWQSSIPSSTGGAEKQEGLVHGAMDVVYGPPYPHKGTG